MAPKRGAASAPPDDQGARFQAKSPRKSLKHDIALGEVTQASIDAAALLRRNPRT